MSPLVPAVVAGIVVVLVLVVVLEGRRQRRLYGRGSGRSAMASGMLELQRHLEPERKVEHLLDEQEEDASTRQGEGPSPDEG